jgi:hypothetical protein
MQQHKVESGNGVGKNNGIREQAKREGDRCELRDDKLDTQQDGENQDSDLHQPREPNPILKCGLHILPDFSLDDRAEFLFFRAASNL